MSNLGPQWEDNEDYAPARMDAKTITRDTGTNIVAIASTRQLGIVIPTDTSAGLIKNVAYLCEYDGGFDRTAFIPIFGKHTHAFNTEEEGGDYFDILKANTSKCVEINMFHINLADWKTDITGSGTFTYDEGTTSGRLKEDTGATNNSCVTGSLGGGKLTFTDDIVWQAKIELTVGTNLLVRCGINVDRVDESQNTTRAQLGIEGCDGHGANWVIINANGNSASLHVQATTAALVAGSVKNYKLINLPSNECRMYENGVSVGVSTTNVPFQDSTDGLRLVRIGIKTTSAASKILYLNLMKILGNPGASDLS